MAGKIPRDFIQNLLARVDLVDLIDARIPLKPSGSRFVACCPFHNEKTPSFSVNRDKQFYYCFGCGVHGNAISFLMEYDRLGFVEAVEALAQAAGLEVPGDPLQQEDTGEAKILQDLFEIQEQVTRFFQAQLKADSIAGRAVEYLKSRGVSGETARHYRLGYAPPGWNNLPAGLPQDLLESAGLLVNKGGRHYDRFRDRIMFPIRDRRGRVAGFGGRVLGDDTPKYLNSPETPLFKKHREVYGLYEVLKAAQKPARIVVVEGYMDVIALAQYGVWNAVATLGTATSGEHVDLLFRYTRELVFCFDGDTAGQNAAWKALEASLPALREGKSVRFLALPEQHDPDSLIRTEGTEAFLARVENAQPFSTYFFEHLKRRSGLPTHATMEQRTALRTQAQPLIERIPAGTFREMVERRLDELTDFDSVERASTSAPLLQGSPTANRDQELPVVRTLLILLLQNPELAGRIPPEARKHLTQHATAGAFMGKLFMLLEELPELTVGGILEFFRGTPEERWVARLIGWNTDILPDRVPTVFMDALSRFERQIRTDRLDELLQKPGAQLTAEEREEMRTLTTQPHAPSV